MYSPVRTDPKAFPPDPKYEWNPGLRGRDHPYHCVSDPGQHHHRFFPDNFPQCRFGTPRSGSAFLRQQQSSYQKLSLPGFQRWDLTFPSAQTGWPARGFPVRSQLNSVVNPVLYCRKPWPVQPARLLHFLSTSSSFLFCFFSSPSYNPFCSLTMKGHRRLGDLI